VLCSLDARGKCVTGRPPAKAGEVMRVDDYSITAMPYLRR
jgi:hypothetical protein